MTLTLKKSHIEIKFTKMPKMVHVFNMSGILPNMSGVAGAMHLVQCVRK